MTDGDSANASDGFDYDREGHVIPPAGSIPWDAATLVIAFAIPIMSLRLSLHSPLPPLGLQKLSVFELALSHGLMRESQLRNAELLFVVLIIARLASFPSYCRKYTKIYSGPRRPPDVWKKAWPRQVRLLFLVAAIFLGGVEIGGFLIELASSMPGPGSYVMTAREVSLPIFILAAGLWLLTGSVLSAALYWVFYRRFWRDAIVA